MTQEKPVSLPKRLFQKFILNPVKQQLSQGTSLEKVALTLAITPVITIFPILGTTTITIFLAGYLLKLNLPFMFLYKTLFYPLHLALILVFVRIGETINGAEHIPFSIPELIGKFKDSPTQFVKDFGITALYGIEAWAILTPGVGVILYFIAKSLLKRYAPKLQSRKKNKKPSKSKIMEAKES